MLGAGPQSGGHRAGRPCSGSIALQILLGPSVALARGMPPPTDQVRREDRLGDDSPPYQLLFVEDLPEEWTRPLDSEYLAEVSQRLGLPGRDFFSYVCVELPDYAWAHHYERWSRGAADAAVAAGRKPLGIMLTAQDEFRNLPTPDERRRQASECLRSLATHGKPLPLFTRVFGPAAEEWQ